MSDYVPGTEIIKPEVTLIGRDGNAFAIIGAVSRELRRADVPKEIIAEFKKEAMSGDYDNVLQTAMEYAEVY